MPNHTERINESCDKSILIRGKLDSRSERRFEGFGAQGLRHAIAIDLWAGETRFSDHYGANSKPKTFSRQNKRDVCPSANASLPFNCTLGNVVHWIVFALYNLGFGSTFAHFRLSQSAIAKLNRPPACPASIIAKTNRSLILFANYDSTCESFATMGSGYRFFYESSFTSNELYIDLFILKTIRKSNQNPKVQIAYRPERFAKRIVKSISELYNRFCDS